MAKGIWLTKNEILTSQKITEGVFLKTLAHTLKWKIIGSRKKYFLTDSIMTKKAKELYGDMLEVIEDEESKQVEEILGEISSPTNIPPIGDLDAARLANLQARTKLIEEKLENRKNELWSEWNEKFYDVFSEAFGKFKNELISLHLDEEQLTALTEKLNSALKIMQDRLDYMYNEFVNEEEEQK